MSQQSSDEYYDNYGQQQPYEQTQTMTEEEHEAYYGRTTAQLDAEAGIDTKKKKAKKEKASKGRRAPLTTIAVVVIGVVIIVVAPLIAYVFVVSLRPDEVTGSIPVPSEAVMISAVSGMLGLVGGMGLREATDRGDRDV